MFDEELNEISPATATTAQRTYTLYDENHDVLLSGRWTFTHSQSSIPAYTNYIGTSKTAGSDEVYQLLNTKTKAQVEACTVEINFVKDGYNYTFTANVHDYRS